MRNLRNIQRSVLKISEAGLPLTATAWDPSTDSLICSFGPLESNAVIELKRIKNIGSQDEGRNTIASWDAPSPHPEIPFDRVLSLQYFSDTAISCLVLAGGDIVVVREQPLPGEDLIEIVGSVDAGITAAAWSPDEELLAIATRADTLLYMTRDFENITSITFTPEDIKASNHVSVGWGKAETQFKGKRAKALRDPTMPERIDEGLLSPLDDGAVTISWRGDGAFLAVNSIEAGKRRMIRVYSRDGVLDSVSEPVDYLEGALSWRPAGNLIAGVQRLDNRIDVVFFERNGLRHGQFSLRLTAEEGKCAASSIDLKWNVDSTVLAVCFKDRVQLWTMGNYHYYLKQEIRTQSVLQASTAVKVCWHPESPLRLAVYTDDALQKLEYILRVSGGSTVPPNDYGTVAAIDGKVIKLTPLRLANVPPPMSLHEIHLDHNAVDVSISMSGSSIAVLHDKGVKVYDYDLGSKPIPQPVLKNSCTFPDIDGYLPRQIAFAGQSDPHILFGGSGQAPDSIWSYEAGLPEIRLTAEVERSRIATMSSRLNYRSVCYQLTDGSVNELTVGEPADPLSTSIERVLVKFPTLAPWMEVVYHEGESLAFALTANGTLYANERPLIRNCTSFLVTSAHLIFTTTQHLLKFVHLAPVGELELPPDEPEKDERCRAIERGARLVAVVPTAYSLTLQMPRGNLETIYPRALVLASIRRSIAAKDYRTAFFACRSQRVDMNILHDHAPEQFMANVSLFTKQIKKVEHIDLFLSQLREEDVSQSLYKETLKAQGVNGDSAILNDTTPATNATIHLRTSKINRICDAFLDVLQDRTATNLQNIITANVCKQPPDLEGGLSVIAKLREQQDDMAEKAAEHICFLADVNQLYDNALGMYDLELTLLIAQQSQKDPREYLPYLQSLQEMPELRRKFTIDDHLGRHTKALDHLHSLDSFDELKAYVEKHKLYTAALSMYWYQPERLNAIMKMHADFLSNRNRFREAGVAYEYLGDYASASEAYRAANMWRESLSSATLIPLPAEELPSLASALADGLAETKDFCAAATIHLDYLSDIEAAARLFCKGYFFAEAMRIVGLHRRPELLSTIIDAGLVEGSASMTELLADCKSQLAAQVPRLHELRVKKAEDPLAFYDDTDPTADIPDNVSLAPTDASTSGGTFLTRYTNRTGTVNTTTTRKTSKNRRREERKRARGKKGSVYEEEYLVNSIGRLIDRVNSVGEEVGRLVEGLMRRGMRERALAVEAAMGEVVEGCRACVDEVWQVEKEAEVGEVGEDGLVNGEARPMGGEGVLWDSLGESARKTDPPVVKAFERLSLLG